MYYEQLHYLMQGMTQAYCKGLGQIYFRYLKQFYSRVRSELIEEKQTHYDEEFHQLAYLKEVEITEFRGLVYDFKERRIAEKSRELLEEAYELQQDLFRDLETSNIFTFLKENIPVEEFT